jgi:hypothetical protein
MFVYFCETPQISSSYSVFAPGASSYPREISGSSVFRGTSLGYSGFVLSYGAELEAKETLGDGKERVLTGAYIS